jgi:putative acetyltransferase
MLSLARTNSDNKDFVQLVAELDAYLAVIDGKDHAFYDQYNKIDKLNHTVVVYYDGKPVGCGAFKQIEEGITEIKRMYVSPEARCRGVGAMVLKELEQWSAELGYRACVLETGKRQFEAVALYRRSGYQEIPNYGQYSGVENSVCFEKTLPFS